MRHGSQRARHERSGPRAAGGRPRFSLAVLLVLCGAVSAGAESRVEMRLRIAWGGGTPRAWSGQFSLTGGSFSEIRGLGLEPTAPGSLELDGRRVVVHSAGSTDFNGLDVTVTAPADAVVELQLSAGDAPRGPTIRAPLSQLAQQPLSQALDAEGNRILIDRSPGDRLHVETDRDSLVLSPGEKMRLTVTPRLLGLGEGVHLTMSAELSRLLPAENGRARQSVRTISNLPSLKTRGSGAAPVNTVIELEAPAEDGAYEVAIRLHRWRLTGGILPARPDFERLVQFVVVGKTPPKAAPADAKPRLVSEIDPAKPNWWTKLIATPQWNLIPGMGQGPLSHGKVEVVQRDDKPFTALEPGAWKAIPLPVEAIGQPHLLEVEFATDAADLLMVSILEPNSAGKVLPMGLDTGVAGYGGAAAKTGAHRIVFWPRTRSPIVLIANQHPTAKAVFGRVRLLAFDDGLPAKTTAPHAGGRAALAYYARPLVAANFGASQARDDSIGRSLDDWLTFYQAGVRLAAYLRYAGYSGAVISVYRDGGALYPSKLLAPTPKHDTGAFLSQGQDPQQKDVLELLFRLFDRQGLQLTPAVRFTATAPGLETAIRQGGLGAEELLPPRPAAAAPERSTRPAAPYNSLAPAVHDLIVDAVAELCRRYGGHESFGGVALQLAPGGLAHVSHGQAGLDAASMARFQRSRGLPVGGDEAARNARRREIMQGARQQDWRRWRAAQFSGPAGLYQRIAQELKRVRSNARLLIEFSELLQDPELAAALRPALPSRSGAVATAFTALGIDTESLGRIPGVVLLRPRPLSPAAPLVEQWSTLDSDASTNLDRQLARGPGHGQGLVNNPRLVRLPSFEEKSPWGAENTHIALWPQYSPAGPAARRQLTMSLAGDDATVLLDGGWMLPLGQQHETREWLAVYRSLPRQPFVTEGPATGAEDRGVPPAIVRRLHHDGRTYVYVLNPCPWPIQVQLDVACPPRCRVARLGGDRTLRIETTADGQRWLESLPPYALAAIVVDTPLGRVSRIETTNPTHAERDLARRLDKLAVLFRSLAGRPPLASIENAGFETSLTGGRIVGWIHEQREGVQVEIAADKERKGPQVMRVTSRGPVAWVRSKVIPAPRTGRLALWVWLRAGEAPRQSPLRLAVQGRLNGSTYYRFASVGGGSRVALSDQWAPYLFRIEDLPAEGLTQLRVGFDLMGAGEVYIDDLQVFDMSFTRSERDELSKILSLAEFLLRGGQLGRAHAVLEGYWPRFLQEHAATRAENLAARPNRLPPTTKNKGSEPAARATWYDRVKGILPRF